MIIADGFDVGILTAVRTALIAEGATTWVIAPRRGMIFPTGVDPESGTGGLMADHHLEGQRSTMFDAVFVCPGAQSTLTLREVGIHFSFFPPHSEAGPRLTYRQNGRAVHWVREAFGHLKPIGALGDAVSFLQQAVVLPGVDLAADPNSDEVVISYGVVTCWKRSVGILRSLAIEPSTLFSSAFAHEISKHRCWERELDGLHTKLAF